MNHRWGVYSCILIAGILVGVLTIGGNFSKWTWLLILLCPLMHLFMMHDIHGEHKSNKSEKNPNNHGKQCH